MLEKPKNITVFKNLKLRRNKIYFVKTKKEMFLAKFMGELTYKDKLWVLAFDASSFCNNFIVKVTKDEILEVTKYKEMTI